MSRRYVKPDGAGHASYLPSALLDHDLVLVQRMGALRNDSRTTRSPFTNVTPNGHLSDHWTVGPAVAWLPAYAAADAARAAVPMLRGFARNGFSLPYAIAIVVSSAMAGLRGVARSVVQAAIPVAGRFAATLAAIGISVRIAAALVFAHGTATMGHAVSAAACAVVRGDRAVAAARDYGVANLRGRSGVRLRLRGASAKSHVRPRADDRRRLAAAAAAKLARDHRHFVIGCSSGTGRRARFCTATPLAFATARRRERLAFVRAHPSVAPVRLLVHGMWTWTPLLALSLIGLLLLWRDDRRLAAPARDVSPAVADHRFVRPCLLGHAVVRPTAFRFVH